nr:retrovirus-related Pol polyprotein from transposon TNT 1-94 [Tanacetum cinerariifolium]
MDVHDNDVSESLQPSRGKMCTSGTLFTLTLPGQLPGELKGSRKLNKCLIDPLANFESHTSSELLPPPPLDYNSAYSFVKDNETKFKSINQASIRCLWLGNNIEFVASDSIGASGGILTMWDFNLFSIDNKFIDRNFIGIMRSWVGIQAGFESHPPMLNKENYVPWSSRLLRYAKSRPNGKLIQNSILNDDELSDKELNQIEADDQAIQTILLGLPEDIYAAVDSCETTQEIWFTSNEGESIESYYHRFLKLMNDLKRNKHFPEKIASNLKFLNNLQPEWSRHVTIVHQTKDLYTADYTQLYDFLKYNQKEVIQKAVQNPRVQNVGNQNCLIGVQGNGNQNQIGNGNLVAERTEGSTTGQNGNQIRCYNCKGVGHYAKNCIVKPRRRDDAYLQTQLLIAQKEEAGIQLQAEEYDLMAAAADLDEIEEVNANCILMANLQQASTSGTQTDSAPVYDTDGSTEVHENCDDNEIFNMFTQEEQYTELL